MEATQTISPGVVIDGQTVYPPGWMYVLGFALRGCEWAVKEADTPAFREMVRAALKLEDARREKGATP